MTGGGLDKVKKRQLDSPSNPPSRKQTRAQTRGQPLERSDKGETGAESSRGLNVSRALAEGTITQQRDASPTRAEQLKIAYEYAQAVGKLPQEDQPVLWKARAFCQKIDGNTSRSEKVIEQLRQNVDQIDPNTGQTRLHAIHTSLQDLDRLATSLSNHELSEAVATYRKIESDVASPEDIHGDLQEAWQNAHSMPSTRDSLTQMQIEQIQSMEKPGRDDLTPVGRAIRIIQEMAGDRGFLEELYTFQHQLGGKSTSRDIGHTFEQIKRFADNPTNRHMRPALQEMLSMSPAERDLDNEGYSVIDKHGPKGPSSYEFPRTVIIRPWREDAELTNRPAWDKRELDPKKDDLKELKALTKEILTQEFMRELEQDLLHKLEHGYESVHGYRYQKQPDDWKKVIEGIIHFAQTGETPEGFSYNIKVDFPEAYEKVEKMGIAKHIDQAGAESIHATSELTYLWENFTGLNYRDGREKMNRKIINVANLSRVFQGTTFSVIENRRVFDEHYGAYGEIYKEAAEWRSISDKTTRGEIHLSVDYRSKRPLESILVVWKDDKGNLHISNQQAQLSQKIAGASETFQQCR